MTRTNITGQQIKNDSIEIIDLVDFAVTERISGLTVDVSAGRIRNDNTIIDKVAVTLIVDDNTTTYVEIDNTGTVQSNTSGFTSGNIALAIIVSLSGNVITVTDKRTWISAGGTGGSVADGSIADSKFLDFYPTNPSGLNIHLNGGRFIKGDGTYIDVAEATITLPGVVDGDDFYVYLLSDGTYEWNTTGKFMLGSLPICIALGVDDVSIGSIIDKRPLFRTNGVYDDFSLHYAPNYTTVTIHGGRILALGTQQTISDIIVNPVTFNTADMDQNSVVFLQPHIGNERPTPTSVNSIHWTRSDSRSRRCRGSGCDRDAR